VFDEYYKDLHDKKNKRAVKSPPPPPAEPAYELPSREPSADPKVINLHLPAAPKPRVKQPKRTPKHDHGDHRARMRARALSTDLDGFAEHEVLEMLLAYSIPRVDVNPTAHALINRFGSLWRVLEASADELAAIDGVGAVAASFLSLFLPFYRAYALSKVASAKVLHSSADVGAYLRPFFTGRNVEMIYLLCLDNARRVIACERVCEGTDTFANVDPRVILQAALSRRAQSAVIAHNHPRSLALPSSDDLAATRSLVQAFKLIGITLADHLIFSDEIDAASGGIDYVSLKATGAIE